MMAKAIIVENRTDIVDVVLNTFLNIGTCVVGCASLLMPDSWSAPEEEQKKARAKSKTKAKVATKPATKKKPVAKKTPAKKKATSTGSKTTKRVVKNKAIKKS